MPRRPKKTAEHRETIHLDGLAIPVRIITERRNNARASVTQKALIIRVPAGMPQKDREKAILDMKKWAFKTYEQQPKVFAQFHKPTVSDRYTFSFAGEEHNIIVERTTGGSHRIDRVGEGRLRITLNTTDLRTDQGKIIPKLLAKYFAGQHLASVARRVHELNDAHFQKPINTVKLSDTYARWGSCSSKGNINLATRLLLAPPEILDAVIIHELAHLVEANHSHRFWAEVARALPNYKVFDKWLKEHGRALLFQPTPVT